MDTVRVGLIGAGWMGVVHAQSWQANAPRGEIVAVADVSGSRTQHIADRFTGGRARVHAELDSLLTDPSVDAVDICLPHHLHVDAILRAARAGKAIMCEKPLCTSLEDAAAIRRAIHETGVTFMAAHNQLFQPSLAEARRLLTQGVIGRPFVYRSIEVGQNRMFASGQPPVEMGAGESSFSWRVDPRRMGGGEVLDTGWHATYRLLALANERPVEVMAMTHRYFVEQLAVEDTGLVLVRFASGAIGEIVTSWAFGLAGGWQFEIGAELGSIAGNARKIVHQIYGWPAPAERVNDPVSTYTLEITHFLNVVQRGETLLPTVDQASRVLQIIQAAYRSAAEHRAVALLEEPTEL